MNNMRYFLIILLLSTVLMPQAWCTPADTLAGQQQLAEAKTSQARYEAYLGLAESYLAYNGSKALHWAQKAFQLADSTADNHAMNRARLAISKAYLKLDALTLSEKYLNQALKQTDTTAKTEFTAHLHSQRGRLANLLGKYPLAAQHLLSAATTYKALNDTVGLAGVYNNIGNMYAKQSLWYLAKQHYKQALPLYLQANSLVDVSHIYNNLGGVYLFQDSIDLCFEHLDKSLAIKKSLGIAQEISTAYNAYGEVYNMLKQYNKSIIYHEKALKIQQNEGHLDGMVISYLGMANGHLGNNQLTPAEANALKALQLARQIRRNEYASTALQILTRLHKSKGQYQQAFQYQSQHKALEDSLTNAKNVSTITALKLNHELEQKDIANQLLVKEKEAQQASLLASDQVIKKQRIAATALTLLLASVIAIALIQYNSSKAKKKAYTLLREKNKEVITVNHELGSLNEKIVKQNDEILQQKNHLEDLNHVKDRLFSIISHDLRSPLSSLRNTLNLIQNGVFSESELKQILERLSDKLGLTSGLLDNLLNWARSQLHGLEINPRPINMAVIMSDALRLLKAQADHKAITLKTRFTEQLYALADEEMVKVVLRNLISNAIKFSFPGNTVFVDATLLDENYLVVSVKDNGMGIEVNDLPKILGNEHFTTIGTDQEKGTGLGLLLSKEFVEKNGGRIWVRSTTGKGSTFSFTLPLYSTAKLPAMAETTA